VPPGPPPLVAHPGFPPVGQALDDDASGREQNLGHTCAKGAGAPRPYTGAQFPRDEPGSGSVHGPRARENEFSANRYSDDNRYVPRRHTAEERDRWQARPRSRWSPPRSYNTSRRNRPDVRREARQGSGRDRQLNRRGSHSRSSEPRQGDAPREGRLTGNSAPDPGQRLDQEETSTTGPDGSPGSK
jgi:hypothetical protein